MGYTFLACVLANLHRAPLLVPGRAHPAARDGRATLWAEDVSAIVAPASACGGPAVLSLLGSGRGQRTVLVVRAAACEHGMGMDETNENAMLIPPLLPSLSSPHRRWRRTARR